MQARAPSPKKKKKKSESPPSPLPPVSVFGPNKFSPAPPITSSYFLSGTALRKQSELRVRGGLDGQRLTRQEAEGKVDTHAHTHTHTHRYTHMHTYTPYAPLVKSNICSLIPAACPRKTTRVKSCTQEWKCVKAIRAGGIRRTFLKHSRHKSSPQLTLICCLLANKSHGEKTGRTHSRVKKKVTGFLNESQRESGQR